MSEEFEDRDLSESVFWGVNLEKSTFRDTVLNGSTFFHSEWMDVSIDGTIERLVINGVDVTEHVNANDRWYPLRTQLFPDNVEGMRVTWSTLCAEWEALFSRVASADTAVTNTSVGGEWSLRDTVRHLLFAMDKWFTWPVMGGRTFAAAGLPNTGSQGLEWPGIDMTLDPDWNDVLEQRRNKADVFSAHLSALDISAIPELVDVMENGEVPGIMCYHVVFEEEFEHLRYALRDLSTLGL